MIHAGSEMKSCFAGGHHVPLLPGAGPQGVPLPQDAARDARRAPGKCNNTKTNTTTQSVGLARIVNCVDFKTGVAFSKPSLFLLGQTTQES